MHSTSLRGRLALTLLAALLGALVLVPGGARADCPPGAVCVDGAAAVGTGAGVSVGVAVPSIVGEIDSAVSGGAAVAVAASPPVPEPAPAAVTVESAPAPVDRGPCTAWWVIGGAAGSGVSWGGALDLTAERALFGGELRAHVALGESASIDALVGFFGGDRKDERGEWRLGVGLRLVANPRDAVRFFGIATASIAHEWWVARELASGNALERGGSMIVLAGGGGIEAHLFGPVLVDLDAKLSWRANLDGTRALGVELFAGPMIRF